MKILAIADLHADEDALDRLRVLAGKNPYDAVLVAGDITNNGPVSYASDLLELFPHALCVHGNMDPPQVSTLLSQRGCNLHGRRIPFGPKKEWNIVGLGGSNPTPFHTPSENSDEEISKILSNTGMDEFSIFLSHPPPFGAFDTVAGGMHVGSKAVLSAIEKHKPLLCICAHIHEHEGQQVLGETLVVKLPPALKLRAAEITIGENLEANFISFE
ncbi:3',5'-cyclic adenosine monophosphate phosphodiesterase CpdA [Candidatus Anstonella stagnisolia]|nr:3',5'-cyclic adenosine monophosphate phosphodiesterase CpdA [Candidatus Anstonella stagnisolia]